MLRDFHYVNRNWPIILSGSQSWCISRYNTTKISNRSINQSKQRNKNFFAPIDRTLWNFHGEHSSINFVSTFLGTCLIFLSIPFYTKRGEYWFSDSYWSVVTCVCDACIRSNKIKNLLVRVIINQNNNQLFRKEIDSVVARGRDEWRVMS